MTDRSINRKYKKHKVYSSFQDNILAADNVDMQLKSMGKIKESDFCFALLIFAANMHG